MADPDNLVPELLREIRADVKRLEAKVDARGERMESLETRLDGLTHAVIAGFGSPVHELGDVKRRLDRLERERA